MLRRGRSRRLRRGRSRRREPDTILPGWPPQPWPRRRRRVRPSAPSLCQAGIASPRQPASASKPVSVIPRPSWAAPVARFAGVRPVFRSAAGQAVHRGLGRKPTSSAHGDPSAPGRQPGDPPSPCGSSGACPGIRVEPPAARLYEFGQAAGKPPPRRVMRQSGFRRTAAEGRVPIQDFVDPSTNVGSPVALPCVMPAAAPASATRRTRGKRPCGA